MQNEQKLKIKCEKHNKIKTQCKHVQLYPKHDKISQTHQVKYNKLHNTTIKNNKDTFQQQYTHIASLTYYCTQSSHFLSTHDASHSSSEPLNITKDPSRIHHELLVIRHDGSLRHIIYFSKFTRGQNFAQAYANLRAWAAGDSRGPIFAL